MIPKRDKDTDISTDIAQGKMFKKRLMKLVDEITNRFIEKKEGLNETIAEVSKREKFNQVQIQRLVEETNTIAYNKRYNQMKRERDRRISFELAELERVLEIMGTDAPSKIENPNWVTGKAGEGNMDKKASVIETTPIHNPNSKITEKRERLLEKRASYEKKQLDLKKERARKEINSNIFKIANSLVMTERMHKKASETFNTMIADVPLPEDVIEGIQKKASDISTQLIDLGRVLPSFMVSLEVNHTEKVANTLLGEHSLLNSNKDTTKISEPKVAPTSNVANYQQLIELAKRIQQDQEMLSSE